MDDLPAVSKWQFHSSLNKPADSFQSAYSPYYVSHTLHRVLSRVMTPVHTSNSFTQYRRSAASNSLLVKRAQILAWHPEHADAETYRLVVHLNADDHPAAHLPPDLAAFAVEFFRLYKPWIRPEVPYDTVRAYTRMCSIMNDVVSAPLMNKHLSAIYRQ